MGARPPWLLVFALVMFSRVSFGLLAVSRRRASSGSPVCPWVGDSTKRSSSPILFFVSRRLNVVDLRVLFVCLEGEEYGGPRLATDVLFSTASLYNFFPIGA